MEKTLNQIMLELQEIATQHRQINEFFQGDFLDAISRDGAQYPLMVATLQPGGMGAGYVRVNIVITICDKYNLSNYRQINEVHSDCLLICNDIKTTLQQYRWTEFADVTAEIATDPFINQGQDMVAGWTMLLSLNIFDSEDWCAIPYDDYDFENGGAGGGNDCDPITEYNIYVDGILEDNFFQATNAYGLFAQTASSTPITNTAVETSLLDGGVGTLTVAANALIVGDSFRGVLNGHISCNNSATIHIRIKSGSVLLVDTGVVALDTATNKHWQLDIRFTVRAIGAAGVAKIASGGLFSYQKNSGINFEGMHFSTENNTTFDTTINNTLVITAQWGAANAANSIYSDLFVFNKIY